MSVAADSDSRCTSRRRCLFEFSLILPSRLVPSADSAGFVFRCCSHRLLNARTSPSGVVSRKPVTITFFFRRSLSFTVLATNVTTWDLVKGFCVWCPGPCVGVGEGRGAESESTRCAAGPVLFIAAWRALSAAFSLLTCSLRSSNPVSTADCFAILFTLQSRQFHPTRRRRAPPTSW